MHIIDVFLLVTLLPTALCLITIPHLIKGFLKTLVAIITVLVFIQLFTEGYYWQFIPCYLILLLLVIKIFSGYSPTQNLQRRLLQFVFAILIFASIIPWMITLPIPSIPEPQGDNKVGTRIFRWVDDDREELITSDPHDKRNVVVQAWYPTTANVSGSHSFYIDGLDNLAAHRGRLSVYRFGDAAHSGLSCLFMPDKIGIIPRWIFNHYDEIDTHAILNAPISTKQRQWPVIIFLTGNVASRAFYSTLVAGLASHGYVVLAIDHPYEAMITQLANGSFVTTIESHSPGEDLYNFMKARLDLRVADVEFVLNQISSEKNRSSPFFSSLNKDQIVITGHSLGGATAAVAMAVDSRIKAAVNIDGTLYGEVSGPNSIKPFMLIESKKDDSVRFLRYEEGNQKLFKHFGGGYRYEIREADHYSFTDAPFLLAAPSRFFVGHFLHFGNIPEETSRATVDILDAFFRSALENNLIGIHSVVPRYPEVAEKAVN